MGFDASNQMYLSQLSQMNALVHQSKQRIRKAPIKVAKNLRLSALIGASPKDFSSTKMGDQISLHRFKGSGH